MIAADAVTVPASPAVTWTKGKAVKFLGHMAEG
jgi:hypothetical protein